jgi:predicted TIM-barrel fold metal-dependent hydrolase
MVRPPVIAACPMILPGECLAEVETLGLDREVERLFLYENAVRVFKLGATKAW